MTLRWLSFALLVSACGGTTKGTNATDAGTQHPHDDMAGGSDLATSPGSQDLGTADPSTTDLPPSACGTATALAQLTYASAGTTIDGVSGPYDGVHALEWNGNVMLGPVADPNGSGRTVDLHRIMEAAPYAFGTTHRSEITWGDDSSHDLPPGVDVWEAFAVMRKADEALPDTTTDDSMLVAQAHSPEEGDTFPPYALVFSKQSGTAYWTVSYDALPPDEWGPDMAGRSESHVNDEPLPPTGQWYRYILHYRAGYLASQNPIFEVWRGKPGQDYELLFSHTGLNTYNGGNAYPRIGPYKWDTDWRGQSSLAYYETGLYYGRGANLYDEAVTALCGL